REFEQDIQPVIIEVSQFIEFENVLEDLPLPVSGMKYLFPKIPFKGLDYFTENDCRIFFGRGPEIKEIYDNIENFPLVLLYGQSGVGKSSLLFAGLKPRMENKGWNIQYIRREASIDLFEQLILAISQGTSGRHLLIIDQLEEIITNPNKILSVTAEIRKLLEFIGKSLEREVHIVLSFRKEYLAEIKSWLSGFNYTEVFIRALQIKGVMEAIEGIMRLDKARNIYKLSYESHEVPRKIAQTILSDEESHVAPLLQLLLRKLWDKVSELPGDRIFTHRIFEEVKSQSLNEFIVDQLNAMEDEFQEEISSGLILDILLFFTTQRNTAASRTDEELFRQYEHHNMTGIITSLKKRYLLNASDGKGCKGSRLAHDSLAPLVREIYTRSNLPGQRAFRILEGKAQDIASGAEVEFSKSDVSTIDAGETGMRKLTVSERNAIEESRSRIKQYQNELDEKNMQIAATVEMLEELRQQQAADLHDDAGPLLSTAMLYINEQMVNLSKEDQLKSIKNARLIVEDTIHLIRNMSRGLMPPMYLGLKSAIEDLFSKLDGAGTISAVANFHDYDNQLNLKKLLNIFRVVEELVNNILRHSNASYINLEQNTRVDKFFICIRHDGKGITQPDFERLSMEGRGLTNIKINVNVLKGAIFFDKEPSCYKVTLEILKNTLEDSASVTDHTTLKN
ncbi:MAG: hypothetical protein WCF67_23770, partial [Chitinophagaceae bacterium]